MTTDSINSNTLEPEIETSDRSSDTSPEPLLPRSAWNSQLAYLKAMFRAKKALDRIEREAEVN
jgi:hypothetical protein